MGTAGARKAAAERGRDRAGLAALGLAGAAFVALAFFALDPGTVYSIDSQIKFLQARALADSKGRSSALVYPGEYLDRRREFVPYGPPFVFRSRGEWESIFNTGGALVHAPFAMAGMAGMTMPALAGALLLLWLTRRLDGTPGGAVLPLVLGFGTFLWFYAVTPSEHALAAALTTAACLAAVRATTPRDLVVAGLLVGSAAVLRDEALLVAPGLIAARWWLWRDARAIFLVTAGAAGPLLAIALVDAFWLDRPPAAHLVHAVGLLTGPLGIELTGVTARTGLTWAERWTTVAHYWISGGSTTTELLAFLAALAMAAWHFRRTGRAWPLLALVSGVAAWHAYDVATLLDEPRFVAGAFRLAPFLLFALLPLPAGVPVPRARMVAILVMAIFLGLTLLLIDTTGGKSLGPRLLLPLLPLATVAAWQAIVAYLRAGPRWSAQRLTGVAGLVLVASSVVMQGAVTIRGYAIRNAEDRRALEWMRSAPEPIVVLDDPEMLYVAGDDYFRRIVLLAPYKAGATSLGETLRGAGVASFVVVSRQASPALEFPPFGRIHQETRGRFVLERWRR